ncbi:MAG TPA: hypothetical protein VG184_07935 [Acidimicrobiales bacterium]|nr:hypothetical protein [Acidimicrobiales bacterium]
MLDTEPGTATCWWATTSAGPTLVRMVAMSALNCGSLPARLMMVLAVPNTGSALSLAVLEAVPSPTTVAATAALNMARMSPRRRHSRRASRQPHRITARRAGAPPLSR